MPRSGPPTYTYTLPPIYLAIPGTTITAAQHNEPLEDIAATFNSVQPIVWGGTGAATALAARTALGAQASSAALTALSTAFTAASGSAAASLALAEDTDNGVNTVSLAAPAAVTSNRTITFPDATGTPALLETAAQVITGGARVTPDTSRGTVTTGTVTLDPGDRPMQSYTNGGAHTLAPGANTGYIFLDIINNASAGAITISGWTRVVGSFDTTNGHAFRCGASIGTGGSLLTIQALF